MRQNPQLDTRCTHGAPSKRICLTELRILRELIEYQGDREITGSTLLDAAGVGRQAYLWTLCDDEHLLLLMQRQRFCYWEATHASLHQLRERAIDWLTEPPVDASLLYGTCNKER